MDKKTLLTRVAGYCALHGISESTFGLRAVNDGKLIPRIRGGGSLTIATLAKVQRQLDLPPHERAHELPSASDW